MATPRRKTWTKATIDGNGEENHAILFLPLSMPDTANGKSTGPSGGSRPRKRKINRTGEKERTAEIDHVLRLPMVLGRGFFSGDGCNGRLIGRVRVLQ